MNKRIFIVLLVFVIWGLASCKSDPETDAKKDEKTVEVAEETAEKVDEETEGKVIEVDKSKDSESDKTKGTMKPKPKTTVKKPTTTKPKPKTTAKKVATTKPKKPTTKKPKTTTGTDSVKKDAETALADAETLFEDCKERKIDSKFSEQFLIAQKDMLSARKNVQAKKYAETKKSADLASIRFSTLLNLDSASEIKTEITENTFEGYAPDEYTDAEIEYIRAIDNFGKKDEVAKESSSKSLKLYNTVRTTGYKEWTTLAKNGVENAKNKCDLVKANMSAKTDYSKALKAFMDGQAAEKNQDFKTASKVYSESAEMFTSIYEIVSTKRAEAEKAMRLAREKQERSSVLAAEADITAPLAEEDIVETEEDIVETIEEIVNEPSDAEGDN